MFASAGSCGPVETVFGGHFDWEEAMNEIRR